MREARWLARWEIRRTLPSYPVTTLVWLFFGVLGAGIFLDAFEGELGDLVSADIYLFALCQALLLNTGSRDSWVGAGTAFPARVAFFRSLPISAADVTVSRALSRIPVLVLNSIALFATPYLISVLTGSALAERLSPVAYVWFALMWVTSLARCWPDGWLACWCSI